MSSRPPASSRRFEQVAEHGTHGRLSGHQVPFEALLAVFLLREGQVSNNSDCARHVHGNVHQLQEVISQKAGSYEDAKDRPLV